MKKINKNSIRYLYYRFIKQPGSPDSVARGAAIGLLVGFITPIGPQMITALALAYLFRASKVTAMAFTWITNYATVPIIYPIQCYIGGVIIGSPLSLQHINSIFKEFLKHPSFSSMMDLGMEIVVTFFIGGVVLGTIFAFIGYFMAYGIILRHRQKTDKKLRMRLFASNKNQEANTDNRI